jgi:anhydro-N-acetylmuramic acid kinase
VTRAVVNIGGIANITHLPKDPNRPVIGFDTGPGNCLLDQWIEKHRGERFDRDGEWALGGTVNAVLLERLLSERYFSRAAPKSTGRELFHLQWLDHHLQLLPGLKAQDVQATLLQLTVESIARALEQQTPAVEETYLCGGGAHNTALLNALRQRLRPLPVQSTSALGLDPDWVEGAAFAWLAHRALESLPGNLPSVTGARRSVVLGAIYPA